MYFNVDLKYRILSNSASSSGEKTCYVDTASGVCVELCIYVKSSHESEGAHSHVVCLLLFGVVVWSCSVTHYPHKHTVLSLYGSPLSVYGDYCCES
jgi:hypothetical protein